MAEDSLSPVGHLLDFLERTQRRTIQWIDRGVPRTQRVKLELRFSLSLQTPQQRHDFLFDGIVKFSAVLRRVVEPPARAKSVIKIILEARIRCDLLPQAEQLVEDLFELAGLLQSAFGDQFPGLLTHRAVGFFQKP